MAVSVKSESSLNPCAAHDPISGIATQHSRNEAVTMAPHKDESIEISALPASTVPPEEPPPTKKFTRFKLTILSLCIVTIVGAGHAKGDDIDVATSLIVLFRSLGQAFRIAVGRVIFQNKWEAEVARYIADGSIPDIYRVGSEEAEVAYGVIAKFPEAVQEAYGWVYSDSCG